ncbi:MAG TPA: prohibitin family protein [bacterium]|nr:prohibitin family protein [bacterium]
MFFVVSLIGIVVAIGVLLKSEDPKYKSGSLIAIVVLCLLAMLQIVRIIPAGHVGVVNIFGKVSKVELRSGIRFVNPFADVIMYSVKTQELKEIMDVPSKEGLNVKLEISVLYHLDHAKAQEVFETVGVNYQEIILVPHFRSVVRGVTASFEAKALYTSAREELSKQIMLQLTELVATRGIVIESTPLRTVSLPAGLSKAIEEKLQAEQESERMEFVLLKEKQEADRKRIEAKGIADFQAIVTEGISDKLLKWKGIEATEKLAASPNAKVVIVGGNDGLPLILGSQ